MKKSCYFLFVLALSACVEKRESLHLSKQVVRALDESAQAKSKFFTFKTIELEWDSLIVMPPYTNVKLTSEFFSVDLEVVNETGIGISDQICVLAFLKYGKVNSFCSINRGKYDFAFLPNENFYFPTDTLQLIADSLSFTNKYYVKKKTTPLTR